MIKKSVFEDDLIAGMQRGLQPLEKTAAVDNLSKAVEYLHAAAEIFEDAGMTAKAEQVVRILGKFVVAHSKSHSKEDKEFYNKIMHWMKNPAAPVDPENPQPGEEISMKSLLAPSKDLGPGDEIVFDSILDGNATDDNDAKPKKPKDPTKVSDSHTKGLTPDKMVANLEGHGTMFNMADDGSIDNVNLKEVVKDITDKGGAFNLAFNVPDEQLTEDLLNLDLNEAAVELFGDEQTDKTFEDTD